MKDFRYKYVRPLVQKKVIKNIYDLVAVVPKTIISTDLGIKTTAFTDRMNDPKKWTINQMTQMAELMGIRVAQVFKIIMANPTKSKIRRSRTPKINPPD